MCFVELILVWIWLLWCGYWDFVVVYFVYVYWCWVVCVLVVVGFLYVCEFVF